MPYKGSEKYIFVSYAHKDADTVLPVIEAMKAQGFRLWYDRGIEAGTEWAEYIEDHLIAADSFILFLSRAMIESQNCREEFGLARDEKKNILVVYIEDLKPSDLKHGLRLRIPSYQCLFRANHKNDNSFITEICNANLLQSCRGKAGAATPKAPQAPTRVSRSPQKPSEGLAFSEKSSTTLTVTGIGECTDTDIVIPAQCEGKKVVEIAKNAFSENTDITSVTLPDGILTVERGAFFGCTALEEISLPDSITYIAGSAFYNWTSLRSFTLPKKATSVEIYSFFGCSSLSSVSLHKKLEMIEIGAFMECPHLTTLDYAGRTADWRRLTENCPYWDDDTFITCVRCSDGEVTYERGNAPVLPDDGAEEETAVAEAPVPDLGLAFEKAEDGSGYTLTGIGECTATDLPVPASYEGLPVTRVADGAFSGNTEITEVSLPDTVSVIGSSAFSGCTALKSANIPAGTAEIPMCCFFGCSELTELTVAGDVKSIDVCAFTGCEKLTEISFGGSKAEWEEIANNSWKWNDGSCVSCVHCSDGDLAIEN